MLLTRAPKKTRSTEEDKLTEAIYTWYNAYSQLSKSTILFHVPNQGKRHIAYAKKLKRMGVLAGVADFIMFTDKKILCIELKAGEGKQSKAQKEFQTRCEPLSIVEYYIVRSLDEFIKLVE